jgi:hypothetical protein
MILFLLTGKLNPFLKWQIVEMANWIPLSFSSIFQRAFEPARNGRMKTSPSHFEFGVALGAAAASDQHYEPTQIEPATFNYRAACPWGDLRLPEES